MAVLITLNMKDLGRNGDPSYFLRCEGWHLTYRFNLSSDGWIFRTLPLDLVYLVISNLIIYFSNVKAVFQP